jgi:TrmH family RNA methyltransferase
VKTVQSRDNPFFKELKKLAGSARQRDKAGQALLDGVHLVRAGLEAGVPLQHIVVSRSGVGNAELAALLDRLSGVPVTRVEDTLFAELTELKTPTGILALIARPQPRVHAADSQYALLLETIQDPGNLGSMIRSAAAAGCDAVFLSGDCADAWSPRVLRAGMGGHFALSIIESDDLLATAAAFAGRCHAATLTAGDSLYGCDLRGRVAFAIGNEGAGLSRALQAACRTFTIPMPGRVESLNAAAAAAVCLFEANRQRAHAS